MVSHLMTSRLSFLFSTPTTDPERKLAVEAMYERYRWLGFRRVPHIWPHEIVSLTNPLFIDVRPLVERQISTLPGAVPWEGFELEAYPDRVLIPYCTIGARSASVAKSLRARGAEVYNLAGSILSWVHDGRQVVDGTGPVHRVHVYGARWNLLPEVYEAVW